MVCVQWSGREWGPHKADYMGILHMYGIWWLPVRNENKQMLVQGLAFCLRGHPSSLFSLFPSRSIHGNLGFFSTLWLRRGDQKCPWPNFTYYQALRNLLGEGDVLLYYLQLKGEMNVICHFFGQVLQPQGHVQPSTARVEWVDA